MRILLVNHFPLVGSGSGTYTLNAAKFLASKGHEVKVIITENTTEFETYPEFEIRPIYFSYQEEIPGALPFNFPCFTTHPRSMFTFYEMNEEQIDAYVEAFSDAVEEEVKTFKPDVIHAQHIWLGTYAVARHGVPYVVTAHGTDLLGYGKDERYRDYAKKAAGEAGSVITISKQVEEDVHAIFDEVCVRTKLISNGYDDSLFYPVDTTRADMLQIFGITEVPKYLVLFVGKLTHFKGIDVLLKAAKMYESRLSGEVMTVIAGDGELLAELNGMAKSLDLQNVVFLGHVSHDILNRIYTVADVSVVPSRREPFGLVAIEALACGTPVVATNQGGIPDFINSDVGALVDVDDDIALADAIVDELTRSDKEERSRYVAEYALGYSQSKVAEHMLDLYMEVVEAAGKD